MEQNGLMSYKGYLGSCKISEEDQVLFGEVLFINDLISYEGRTVKEITKAFRGAVNDYIKTCKEQGREVDKPFKGSFNIRIGESLHRKIATRAMQQNISVNKLIKDTLEKKIS